MHITSFFHNNRRDSRFCNRYRLGAHGSPSPPAPRSVPTIQPTPPDLEAGVLGTGRLKQRTGQRRSLIAWQHACCERDECGKCHTVAELLLSHMHIGVKKKAKAKAKAKAGANACARMYTQRRSQCESSGLKLPSGEPNCGTVG
ncbi:hypothetical protein EK21DRAFT_95275 [Setomelanomma holmii]|uniref:Uncharacterized protein n=1 Tax=Setomelanomma holmii TaxID=210430 RepID=A0A9P4GWX3_9PLEO|nr:hypothetical protein EK21DRAFT_95275 [Setomelanomma holmii]